MLRRVLAAVKRGAGQHIIREIAIMGVAQNSASPRYFVLADLWKLLRGATLFPPSALLRLGINHRDRHGPLALFRKLLGHLTVSFRAQPSVRPAGGDPGLPGAQMPRGGWRLPPAVVTFLVTFGP